MTPTHTTRDGRPVTIDKIGKRWMRGWITQEGAAWKEKWLLDGTHPREEALDLTPVANAHLTAIIASSRDLFDDIPEPDPRDAEIDFAAAFVDMAEQVELLNRNENSMLGRISARDAEIDELRWLLDRMCTAYELACPDAGTQYRNGCSTHHAHAVSRDFLARNGGAK